MLERKEDGDKEGPTLRAADSGGHVGGRWWLSVGRQTDLADEPLPSEEGGGDGRRGGGG